MSIIILSTTPVLSNPSFLQTELEQKQQKALASVQTVSTQQGVQIDHSNDYMTQTNSDGSTSLVPYILSQTSNTVTVQTKQGSIVYNNSTCNFAFYNSTSVSGTPLIPSDSYTVKAELDGTTTWIPVTSVNNAACSTKLFSDGTNITLQSTKSVPGTGLFQINYTKHPDTGYKITFKATNQNPLWTNYHLGITETIAVPTHVTLGNTAYDLSLYNNTSFSRTLIQSIHSQIINLGQKLSYNTGLGWNNTNDYTVSYKNNQASLLIDYTYNTPILQPSQTITIDPSISKDTSTFHSQSAGSTNSLTMTIANNANRILIAGVSTTLCSSGTPPTVSTVKIGSTNFQHLANADATQNKVGGCGEHTEIWYLTQNAGLGTGSQTITATFSASADDSGVGGLSLFNVDQTTGLQTGAGNSGNGGTHQVSLTPAATGSWVFGHQAATSSPGGSDTDTVDWHDTIYAVVDGQHRASPTIGSPNTLGWGTASNEWAVSGAEVLNFTGQASGSGITSINSQTGPAVNIVRGAIGNVTITNSTNQIAVNLGSNAVVTGGAAQTISKQMTFSSNIVMAGNITSTAGKEFKISPPSGIDICIGTGC